MEQGNARSDANGNLNLEVDREKLYGNSEYFKQDIACVDAEIISHAEEEFLQIMQLDGITPKEIMKSLNLEDNITSVFKAGEGAGQSGSFFFFSRDKRFIIKTLRGTEMQRLLNMLEGMVLHFTKTKNKSLLARIYGMYTIKSNVFAPLNIIVMQNTA